MSTPLIAILLSGCGSKDGSETHEAVLAMLNIDKIGADYICVSPDMNQHHVINHLDGSKMNETRNVLVESARLAQGKIRNLKDVTVNDFDALVIPGGCGAGFNLTTWNIAGPDCEIHAEVKRIILEFISFGKPIAAFCTGVKALVKATEGTGFKPKLTIGNTDGPKADNIRTIAAGLEQAGAVIEMKKVGDVTIDEDNKIVSAPCYMMGASIYEINIGMEKAFKRLSRWL
jgi:enhancing lycopene biosynthesis protein 2